MAEIVLSNDQVAFALHISRQLATSGFALIHFDLFGQYFGSDSAPQLKFFLSSNAWTMRVDDVLNLVVVTHVPGAKPTWPIKDLVRQLRQMRQKGISEEDKA